VDDASDNAEALISRYNEVPGNESALLESVQIARPNWSETGQVRY